MSECFDPVAGIWQTLAPMSAARCRHLASAIGGQLYIIGGYGATSLVDGSDECFYPFKCLKSTECFDPVTGIWQTLAPMSVARIGHSASVIAGQLHIVGGSGDGDQPLAECFDPVAGIWQALAPMSVERRRHSGSVIVGRL